MLVKKGKRLEYTGRDVSYFADLCTKSKPNEVWMWPVESVDALVVFVHHKDGRKTDMVIAGRTRATAYMAELCANLRVRPPHLFGTYLPATAAVAYPLQDRIQKDWQPSAPAPLEYDKPKAAVAVETVVHTAKRTRTRTHDEPAVAVARKRTRDTAPQQETTTVATTSKRTRHHDTATNQEEDATCARTSRRLRATTNRATSFLSLV